MTEPKLTLATTHYEHADALFDGSVKVAGFDTEVKTEGLAGKAIGEFALWGTDPGVWIKGVPADEFGVTPDQCKWVIGGTNFPIPSFGWVPQPVPENVEVRHAEDDETLGAMLLSGEIDALISVDVPKEILAGDPRVRRLWVDYEQVERDYYRRTGIFPMMHVVAIRKDYLADHPAPRCPRAGALIHEQCGCDQCERDGGGSQRCAEDIHRVAVEVGRLIRCDADSYAGDRERGDRHVYQQQDLPRCYREYEAAHRRPDGEPTSPTVEMRVITRTRRLSSWNSRKASAIDPGVVIAAATPIATRTAMSWSAVVTKAVARLATPSRASPMNMIRRRPNRSAIAPNTSIRPPKTTA